MVMLTAAIIDVARTGGGVVVIIVGKVLRTRRAVALFLAAAVDACNGGSAVRRVVMLECTCSCRD